MEEDEQSLNHGEGLEIDIEMDMDMMDMEIQTDMEQEQSLIHSPVLTLQGEHRSNDIELEQVSVPLTCRRADRQFWKMKPLDERVLCHLAQAGFYGVYCIGQLPLDHSLITALIERWREETHTFHLPVGECTITLQDVSILLGLPVDGDPITSSEASKKMPEWQALCQEILGFTPDSTDFNGNRLRLRCLNEEFRSLPSDADDALILCHARAHILRLFGGLLFPDKSQSKVKLMYLPFLRDLQACGKLSWGSAVLACLYREMCRASKSKAKEIGGPLILLQLWAWERLVPFRLLKRLPREKSSFPSVESNAGGLVFTKDTEADLVDHDQDLPGKPLGSRWRERFRHKKGVAHNLEIYRNQLNELKPSEFVWMPYSPEVTNQLPLYCLSGQGTWHAVSPLICFSIVEWHLPNRVMRQFGFKQMKPAPCDTRRDLHRTDMRGREGYDFEKLHLHHVLLWRDRYQYTISGEPFDGFMDEDDPYLVWYRGITHLRISNPNQKPKETSVEKEEIIKSMAETIENIYQKSDGAIKDYNEDLALQSLIQIRKICRASMDMFQKLHGPAAQLALESLTSVKTPAPIPTPILPPRKRNRGLVAPRQPRKSRKKIAVQSPSVQSPLDVLASPEAQFSPDHPSVSIDPLSSAVVYLPDNHLRLPAVRGEISSSVVPRLCLCPSLPLQWPSSGLLTGVWLMTLERALDWSSRNLPPEQFSSAVPEELFNRLVTLASDIMGEEPNCLRIDDELGLNPETKVVVVGDLHGQLHDLLFLLRDAGYPSDNRFFVFNGNYVDRGSWSLETFLLLLAWKVLFPRRVLLLRGNHETKLCSTEFGFKEEVFSKYGTRGEDVFEKCLSCFTKLPLACVIAKKVYTTHGGLFRSLSEVEKSEHLRNDPKNIGFLEDLSKVWRFIEDPPLNGENAIIGDILWSVPWLSPGLQNTDEQSFGLLWGPDSTDEFLKNSSLKLIIRSHEGPDARKRLFGLGGMEEGYSIDHDVGSGRLITLFSAPDYPQFQAEEPRYQNKGAYIVLNHPDFDSPSVRMFDAVNPRPETKAYYNFEKLDGSREDRSLQLGWAGTAHEEMDSLQEYAECDIVS